MSRAISRIQGVFGLPDYGHRFSGPAGPYLGCRVNLYSTPYGNGVSLGSCGSGMRSTVSCVGGKSVRSGSMSRLAGRVRGTTRGLGFRLTTELHSEVGTVGGVGRGRELMDVACGRRSIVTDTIFSNTTYIRIFVFHGCGL